MATLNITAREFKELVSTVLPMASNDLMLPVLNGVLVETRNGYLTASATDRFRLGIKRIQREGAKDGDFRALIGIADLRRIFAIFSPKRGDNPSLTLTVEDDTLHVEAASTLGFDFASARVSFRLVTGDYPDLRSLIQKAIDEASEDRTNNAYFNPKFLAAFPGSMAQTIGVKLGAPGKPALFVGEDFIGCLMPRKDLSSDSHTVTVPDWSAILADPKPAKRKGRAA